MGLGLGDVLLVLFFLVYLYWLATPRLEDPELVAECLEEARVAHEASQRYAHDPEMNGYLSPTFYPFWGQFPLVKDREEAPVETKVREWAKYSSNWSDEVDWDLESLQTDPEYLELKEWFEGLAEELYRELDKPCFVVPERLGTRRLLEGHSSGLLIAGLQALAESYAQSGDESRAFMVFGRAVQLSLKIGEAGLISGILGYGLFFRSLRNLQGSIATVHPYPEEWNFLSSLCLPAESPLESFEWRLRKRLVEAWYGLQDRSPIRGLKPSSGFQRVAELLVTTVFLGLGIARRETKFACNGFTRLIAAWQAGRLESSAPSRWSLLGEICVPRDQDLLTLANLVLSSQAGRLGLGVSAALLAHRLRHGKFPNDLGILPHEVDSELFEWNPQTGELLVLIPPNLPAGVWKPRPEPENWIEATTRGLLFRLNPI